MADEGVKVESLAVLLRSMAVAAIVATGAVAGLLWMETWEGMPNLGAGVYLLAALLAGALALRLSASRLASGVE